MPAPVERLGPDLYRVGDLQVDTTKREVTVPGHVNTGVTALEFLANTRGGLKAYESAITLETDAINFNIALVLIGLDRANAKPSPMHFDPNPVSGEPVSLTIESADGKFERGPIERLLLDRERNAEVAPGAWVYTGSTFYDDGRYGAEVDGVLIGFAHTPTSVIESVPGLALKQYGRIVLNPKVAAGTRIVLKIKALPRNGARQKR